MGTPTKGRWGTSPAIHQRDELRHLLVTLALRLRADGVEPAARIGLTTSAFSILARLTLEGPLSVKELVADLSVPASTMTALVDRLVGKGLVQRRQDPSDRRLVQLEATRTAAGALLESTAGFERVAAQMLTALSEREREDLLHLLRRAIRTLGRPLGPHQPALAG